MATISDVAKLANVSVGTVSNVLNNYPGVKDETRRRVLEAIEALDYYPLAAARSMKTQRTNTIGYICATARDEHGQFVPDPFTGSLIESLALAAIKSQIGLTYWMTPAGDAEIDLYQTIVKEQRTDGLIIVEPVIDDPRLAYLDERGFPYVLLGYPEQPASQNWVEVDSVYVMKTAVEHLAALGHKRIGYLSPPDGILLTRVRWDAFCRAMQQAELTIDETLVYEGNFREQSGLLGAQYLLDLPDPPTAIIAANDRMAFGAMNALQSRGLTIGKDISIIGVDDITLAAHTVPPLTTFRQPMNEVCDNLFNLLMRVINGEAVENLAGRLIKPEFKVRQTTGPAPVV